MDPDQKKAKIYLEKKIPARREYLRKLEQRKAELEEKRRKAEEERARRKAELERKKREAEAARNQRLAEKRAKEEARKKALEEKKRQLQAQKEKQAQIKSLYQQALSYYKNNQFQEAEEVFQQILSLDPGNKRAKIYLEKKIPARKEYLRKLEQKKAEREKKRREKLARKKAKKEKKVARVKKEKKVRKVKKKAKKPEVTSDFIIVKSEITPEQLYKDANGLAFQGKYEEAITLYNYAYDIARDKTLKKEILKAKKHTQKLLAKEIAAKKKEEARKKREEKKRKREEERKKRQEEKRKKKQKKAEEKS
ncbi:MAG: tetratricopeptide repeat protein [Candidatus Omnitrophica bacterium]|nr:tetratricopeptide repeat protein [Candidatus Omnitrophota bacterium]